MAHSALGRGASERASADVRRLGRPGAEANGGGPGGAQRACCQEQLCADDDLDRHHDGVDRVRVAAGARAAVGDGGAWRGPQAAAVPLLGFDTDNDSVFMYETVWDYCQEADFAFTRCRPYRKNDQAWVQQKNGAVVRCIVSYWRSEGLEAAALLARLTVRCGCS